MQSTHLPFSFLLRTRRISFGTLLLLGVAALVTVQDVTGILWHRDKPLGAAEFLEQQAKAFRYPLRERGAWIPERLESSAAILENGTALEKVSSSERVSNEPSGRYAWTVNGLWVSPVSGKPRDLVASLPVLVPWWLRLAAYGGAMLGILAIFRSKEEQEFWISRALRVQQWLLNGLHGNNPPGLATAAGVVLAAGAVVMLNSGIGRPLWFDEFLHYCLGGYDSAVGAWDVTHATVVKLNHGQTGVYMMLDYWLLKMFGASAFALRLPSLLSALFLLLSSAALLKFRGFGPVWQFLVIIALSAQTSLINFTAEARPYMPLAAAAVGTLAYYLAPAAMRSRAWVAVGGWVAVMLGASMHPYFGLYWLAVFAFAHGLALSEGTLKPGLKTLLRHVNLPLSLAGTAVFLSVGSFTWLRGGPSFKFDPFFWLPREQLINNVVFLHLEFFGRHALRREAWLGFVAALPVLGLLLPRRLKLHLQSLIAPAVLLLLAIGLTAVLCYLSYRRDYWILSRQWVGSIAMATVASIWLWGELARAFARWRSWAGALVVLLLPCLIAAPTLIACREKWQSYRQNLATQSALPLLEEPKLDAPFTERSAEAWVQMANQNIHQGGPVWPYFQHYYAQESVINPVFAEPDKEKRQ